MPRIVTARGAAQCHDGTLGRKYTVRSPDQPYYSRIREVYSAMKAQTERCANQLYHNSRYHNASDKSLVCALACI
jgi:hypothetical protein